MPVLYHIGFGKEDLGEKPPTTVLLCGDPKRASLISQFYLQSGHLLSDNRGLNSYIGTLHNGKSIISATSGMGAPSLSIVVNELIQIGIRQIIRVGTCGSIQDYVLPGSIVISNAALCQQGAANDIAPVEYPAAADPFLTVAMAKAAKKLGVEHHIGITASVDTFYEGQERTDSANPYLIRKLHGITQEYRYLNILNYEMECATLFKMASVYGFKAGCVCAVIAQRTLSEEVIIECKDAAIDNAIKVALMAAEEYEESMY